MICTDKSLEYELRLQDIEAPDLMKTASLLLLFRLDFRIIFLDFERDASLEMCRCGTFILMRLCSLAGSIRIEKD